MVSVGVVGAGVAAAGVCSALDAAAIDAEVTVLEASDAVGGRATTLRRDGRVVDCGANYLKDGDDRVTALVREVLADALVDVAEPVHTFDGAGTVSEGRDADEHRWTCEDGIDALPRRLLEAADARIHCGARVEELRRDGAGESATWTLLADDGREFGPFDAVACTPPAPETARLLETVDEPTAATLAAGAGAVPYRPIRSAVLGYGFALDRPYYALVNTDREHAVGWIAREECKRGHVPDGECVLVVQASPDWTREHDELGADVAAARLAEHAAEVVGDDRLADPGWSTSVRFHAALPDAGLREAADDPDDVDDALATARAAGLHLAGDWIAGAGRLHAAVRSGLEAGDAIAASRADRD